MSSASPETHRPSYDTDPETAEWIAGLTAPRDRGTELRLHHLLLRAARTEVSRRSGPLRVSGPELDDLAQQAADDALVAVLRKLASFRGESRFTTWAYGFVIREVSNKLTRHVWARRDAATLEPDQWERLPDRFGLSPEQAAESADLFTIVRRAVDEALTERQRQVFVALVLDGIPLDVVAARDGTSRNTLYKTMFDARRKIRAFLDANGHGDRR